MQDVVALTLGNDSKLVRHTYYSSAQKVSFYMLMGIGINRRRK